MILRIMGEGQLEVDKGQLEDLNALDDRLDQAVRDNDEDAFQHALTALLMEVRTVGRPVPDETLIPSDLVLPHAEATIHEVRDMLAEDGLLPG